MRLRIPEIMKVTAWNNGKYWSAGAGYGIKIDKHDRDALFDRSSKSVILHLDGNEKPIKVNTNKKSFWGDGCRELINKEIGLWFFENGLAPWPEGVPPKLNLERIKDNEFLLKRNNFG